MRGRPGREQSAAVRWAKVLDQSRCIGCHACTTACKSENEVPLSVTRTYVKSADAGTFPDVIRNFQVTRCNQCDNAPCVTACPTSAMYRRPDGIVDFDKSICIGCKACMAACPYDAIFINPDDHSAEKCNFCAHRLDVGLEPACVTVCPVEAILVGDLNDPSSRVAQMVKSEPVAVRRAEKGTKPKVFYKGAAQSTLDPLAATRPGGGIYAWAEQPQGPNEVGAGVPGGGTSSAAVLLSYDVSHTAPWGWRVGAYTFTKSVAAGTYLVAAGLCVAGLTPWTGNLWRRVAPLTALAGLGVTGLLLITDLKHPLRFYLIFTRPQFKSWLVRGAFIIAAYGAVLTLHLLATFGGASRPQRLLALAGVPLALATAAYTGYLFAQAKARDLWQSRLLAPHLVVQAVLAGAGGLLAFTSAAEGPAQRALERVVSVAAIAHLGLAAAETTVGHSSEHARLAARSLTQGRYKLPFWLGAGLVGLAALAPRLGKIAIPLAFAGLAAYEDAYVRAGQSVPLA
jgi:Fe-S-cluster-containing dehydrogenase component/formate-dependent nitrite reductase membrane component NrfD